MRRQSGNQHADRLRIHPASPDVISPFIGWSRRHDARHARRQGQRCQGHRRDADGSRGARLQLQPRQDDRRQALLRVQSEIQRSQAAGPRHVPARLEIPGRSLFYSIQLHDC